MNSEESPCETSSPTLDFLVGTKPFADTQRQLRQLAANLPVTSNFLGVRHAVFLRPGISNTMPAPLRKACHACTLAKRRCDPQLPQCSRCLKNGIACTYDLEPLKHVSSTADEALTKTTPPEDQQIPSDLPLHVPQPSFSVFGNVASAHEAAILSLHQQNQGSSTPEIRIVADPEILFWALFQMTQIPEMILRNQTSPFVHARLYLDGTDRAARMEHVLMLHKSISKASTEEVVRPSQNVHLQNLTKVDVKGLPVNDVLMFIHELGLYLIIYLCNDLPSRYKSEVQEYLDLFMEWNEHLWNAIQEQPSRNHQSQWHAWLEAESARRSMIGCYFIKASISIFRSGFGVYVPFLESLPFDPRTGLWEAMSEEDWKLAVGKHGGQPEVLISFREFIEGSEDLSNIKNEGLFQKMLLVGFYNKRALQALNSV